LDQINDSSSGISLIIGQIIDVNYNLYIIQYLSNLNEKEYINLYLYINYSSKENHRVFIGSK